MDFSLKQGTSVVQPASFMAAEKDSKEEEKEVKLDIDYENFKYELPSKLNDEELAKFDKELVEVYKHKCKYELNESKDDNNQKSITFYPSPHVKEEEYGKEKFGGSFLKNSWMIRDNLSKLEGMNDWNENVITRARKSAASYYAVSKHGNSIIH